MSETPAETLRRAAKLMREQHGPEHVRHEFWCTLADLLNDEADYLDFGGEAAPALKVARTYLGEESA